MRRQGHNQIRSDRASLALLLPSYVATSSIDTPRTRAIARTVKRLSGDFSGDPVKRIPLSRLCAPLMLHVSIHVLRGVLWRIMV